MLVTKIAGWRVSYEGISGLNGEGDEPKSRRGAKRSTASYLFSFLSDGLSSFMMLSTSCFMFVKGLYHTILSKVLLFIQWQLHKKKASPGAATDIIKNSWHASTICYCTKTRCKWDTWALPSCVGDVIWSQSPTPPQNWQGSAAKPQVLA